MPIKGIGPAHLTDGDHRRALGNERHFGARTIADIEGAGRHGLGHFAAAGKVDDFQVEPVLLEDAERVADINGNDRIRVR